ncbi:excalibur calcium-binding protein [Streptomyces sp. NPDC018947]|uniref:excalibur calcium-binding protein n=1 Tax=Streptomyces sp. NPDC018947 TaxID=3365054 RepID=UPI003794496C
MRRGISAAGMAVAIAAVAPVAGPAHAQDPGRLGVARQEAVRAAFGAPGEGRSGEVLPRPASLPTISATSRPLPPTSAPTPPSTPAVTPTRGVQGGLGGTWGPGDWDIGIGLACVTAAALATGYAVRRRTRA